MNREEINFMKCLEEDILQALLDEELSLKDKNNVQKHLATCLICQQKLHELEELNSFIRTKMDTYHLAIEKVAFTSDLSFKKENIKRKNSNFKGVLRMFKKYQKGIAVAVGVVFIGGMFSFGPVRSAAANLLNVFRMEKVDTISISANDIEEIGRKLNDKGEFNIENFGKFKNEREHKYESIDSYNEAVKKANFKFRIPQELKEKISNKDENINFYSNSGDKLTCNLDVTKVNELLKSFGSEKLLPISLDKKDFTLAIDDSYSVEFNKEKSKDGEGRYNYSLTEIKAPEIILPEGANVDEILEPLLNLPILPYNAKEQLKAVKDLQKTLVFPAEEGKSKKVTVDGTEGILMTENNYGNTFTTLIWQKAGVLHMFSGYNANSDRLLELANTLE
jgi:hypothetical protein